MRSMADHVNIMSQVAITLIQVEQGDRIARVRLVAFARSPHEPLAKLVQDRHAADACRACLRASTRTPISHSVWASLCPISKTVAVASR